MAISTNKIQKEKKMQKNKKGLLMSILWALVIITAVVSSVAMTQSAKVATLHLEQTWTYTPPQNIQVTFDANGGEFSGGGNTINETIKISTLSDGSIFPADEPTKSGYTFAGWEYSVNGTSYSDYASASDMPFTDHLYVRAKWEENLDVKLYVTAPQGSSSNYTYAIFENDTCILYEDAVSNYELTVSYGSEIYISYGYRISYTQHESWDDNYKPQSFVSYYQPDGKSLRLVPSGIPMTINIESTNTHYSGYRFDCHNVNFRATDTSYTITLGS